MSSNAPVELVEDPSSLKKSVNMRRMEMEEMSFLHLRDESNQEVCFRMLLPLSKFR